MDITKTTVVETDVLVIGGGIAGCVVACRAYDKGLKVSLVEKAHTSRSGCAGMGIDHYESVPNGDVTAKALTERFDFEQTRINGMPVGNPNLMFRYFDAQWDTIRGMEELGIPMKFYDGEYYFFNRTDMFPGERYWLRVNWQNVKPLLSKAVHSRDIDVAERTMVTELLKKDGEVVGATAFNTRTGEFITYKAKAVVIATGQFQRAYNSESPDSAGTYQFRYDGVPSAQAGDGYALAYHAGANLCNMDINGWMFRCRDDLTISFGNFEHNDGLPSSYFTKDGDEFPFADAQVYRKLENEGKTPLYRNLGHLHDDYFKRVEICYTDEKMIDFKYAEDRKFNPKSHSYEVTPFRPLSFMASTGIHVGEDLSASVPGLFAIGDCASPLHSCSVACGTGFLLGDQLPEYVASKAIPEIDEAQVEAAKAALFAPLDGGKRDIEPLDLEAAIRYINERYVGLLRSEGKLTEGLRRVSSLREMVLPRVKAENPHKIMRYWEAKNILDLTEAHILSILERKESRGNFLRLDYPEMDKEWEGKLVTIHMEDGKPVIGYTGVPALREDIFKEAN